MHVCSLLVQHDLDSSSGWVEGGRVRPGDAGTDVGRITVSDDVSHVGDISGIIGPNAVSSDNR